MFPFFVKDSSDIEEMNYDFVDDPYERYPAVPTTAPMPWVFWLATSLAFYVGILFIAVGIAAGMYYLAELAEEYTTIARRVMKVLMISVATSYLLIAVVDGVSWWRCLLSIGSQAVYSLVLRSFPWIRPSSLPILGCGVALVVDHVLWYTYFSENRYPYWAVVSFFLLFVWAVPFGYFVTCAVVDQSLPGLGSDLPPLGGRGGSFDESSSGSKRRTFASMLASVLPARVLGEKRN